MVARVTVIVLFLVVLAVPLVFRADRVTLPADAETLIVITPHNEQIRTEFALAFDRWHRDRYGGAVNVVYSVPGGTSEIRKMLQAQYAAAFAAGDPPGGQADVVFGGGSYEHGVLKQGVTVEAGGEKRQEPISEAVPFDSAWLDGVYGENSIGDVALYDPDRYWFGTALSGFGLVFNRDVLATLGLDEPETWSDLVDPALRGWVGLVNPGQSGSITTAFDAILQQLGWEDGWRILRRAAANARYFSASSLKPPADVSQGDAAIGVSIDFYGRYQAQAVKVASGRERVGYVDPPLVSTIDPDPVSMLRGAPHPELARRFIEFCLSEAGQSLWQFRAGDPAGDGLGPHTFELRRLVIRRSMYDDAFDRFIDPVNPFELARPFANADGNIRAFIAPVFAAMAMDTHEELRHAWRAIVTHPAYPASSGVVTADDVADPQLKAMLERFDAMPTIATPDGARGLATADDRATIKRGWLRGGWKAEGLWSGEDVPEDELRRRFARYFRQQYGAISASRGSARRETRSAGPRRQSAS